MTTLPLYDSIIKGVPTKELTVKQKNELICNIEKINSDGIELVYCLIVAYYTNNDGDEAIELPYESTKKEKDITFTIDNFPKKLKQLIYKFLNMHIQTMKEEEGREEFQTELEL